MRTNRNSAHAPHEGLCILHLFSHAGVHNSANAAVLVKALKPQGYRHCCAGRILQQLCHNPNETVVLAGVGFLPNRANDRFIKLCSHQKCYAAVTWSVVFPMTLTWRMYFKWRPEKLYFSSFNFKHYLNRITCCVLSCSKVLPLQGILHYSHSIIFHSKGGSSLKSEKKLHK